MLDVDRSSGLVRVQGGITIRELSRQLATHGLAMENLGDIDVQSIAGAISTATHGTGARLRNISAQVAELTLVLADGSTLRCAEERRLRDLPRRARGPRRARRDRRGHAPLRAPRSPCAASTLPHHSHETLARFEELALSNDHFEFFVFPHADTALTRTNNRTDQPPRPRGRVSAYANDVLLTNHAFELLCRTGRRFPRRIPQLNRLVTRLAGAATRVDRSDRIFASPRLVRFTEMEYALPRAVTPEAVNRIMALVAGEELGSGRASGFAVPFPIEVRTVAPDDALLSTAAGRDSGFVAVHMYRGMAWEPYFRAVEAIMDELGGRPHWGKRHFQTAATLRPRYPDWDRFQAVRARLDPEGRFANAWTDRILGPVQPLSTHHPCRWLTRHHNRTTRQTARGIRASGAGDVPTWRRRSRSSISTRCGPTPRISYAAPPPSRFAWRASPFAVALCRNVCSPARGSPARSPSRSRRRCGSPLTAPRTWSWPIRPPTGRRSERSRRSPPSERATRVTVMVDSAEQLDLIDRVLDRYARRSRRRRAARVHRSRCGLVDPRRPRARRRQALARPHSRAGRRAGARGSRPRRLSAGRDHVLRGTDRRPRRHAARAGNRSPTACPRDPCDADALRARAGRAPRRRGGRGGTDDRGVRVRLLAPRWSSSTAVGPAASNRLPRRERSPR